jgi:hypothetical protein
LGFFFKVTLYVTLKSNLACQSLEPLLCSFVGNADSSFGPLWSFTSYSPTSAPSQITSWEHWLEYRTVGPESLPKVSFQELTQSPPSRPPYWWLHLPLMGNGWVRGHEEVWERVRGESTICEKDRGIEGKAKETHFGKSQSFDRNLPPSPSLSHLFWRNVNVPMFPGDWPAGSLFGILQTGHLSSSNKW